MGVECSRGLPVDQSRFRQLPTSTERQVFTFAMFRDGATAPAALGLVCAGYAAWLFKRKDTAE